MKTLLWIVALVGLAVLGQRWLSGESSLSLVTADVVNPHAPGSPLHAASQRFVDGINADPRLKQRFAGVFTRRGLYAEVNTAVKRGAQSLDGPLLVGATTAIARAVPHLDTHSCAEVFRERDTFDEALSAKARAAFEEISPSHHARLMEFYLQALRAEVDNAPIRPVDQAVMESALKNLGSNYRGQEAERFMQAMGNPRAASDEDLCWSGKTLLHAITLASPRERELLSRWGMAGR